MATDTLLQANTRMAIAAHSEAFDRLLCVGVHDETHDVKSFTFVSPDAKAFDFEAGQHLSLELEIDGLPESRCYSMSSSPARRKAITITVKRTQGGRVSNWLHDNLVAGTIVKALGPLGAFVRPAAAKLLLLSGGSGITPLMSIVRDIADAAQGTDVIFIHAARTPRDLVFRSELGVLAERMKGLRLYFLPEQVTGERSWAGLTGRISKEFLALAVPDLSERMIMCCGPAPFMKAARAFSAELGSPAHAYHEESFEGTGTEEPGIGLAPSPQAKTFKVEFAKQARSIEVAGEQTVLSCAKKAGIRLPSSCANGLCGTCKSKLVSGSVDMQHNGGIRQREVEAGFFLPCCSKPLSDLVIDR